MYILRYIVNTFSLFFLFRISAGDPDPDPKEQHHFSGSGSITFSTDPDTDPDPDSDLKIAHFTPDSDLIFRSTWPMRSLELIGPQQIVPPHCLEVLPTFRNIGSLGVGDDRQPNQDQEQLAAHHPAQHMQGRH